MNFENPIFREQQLESILDKKIGAAKVLASLDEVIRENPDIEAEGLSKIIEEVSEEYQLDSSQVDSFGRGVDRYLDRHQAVGGNLEKFKEQFGENWKGEFFKYCFGVYPDGKVELREGPMTVYWMCDSLKDYAIACDDSEEEAAETFGRRKSLLDEQPEELRGAIIIEYSGHPKHRESALEKQSAKSKTTEAHEEQHVIFDMLDDELDLGPLNFDSLNETSNLKEVKLATDRYLRLRREELERGAKNEIIAYWRDGEKSLDEIREIVLELGGLYDNTGNESEEALGRYLVSRFGDNYKQLISQLNINNTWQEQCEKFNQNIGKAIEVLKEIEQDSPDKKTDYMYLLSLEKTDKWARTHKLVKDKI